MTFAYTQPLPRVLVAPNTNRLGRADLLMVGPLRPFVVAAEAIKGFFKG